MDVGIQYTITGRKEGWAVKLRFFLHWFSLDNIYQESDKIYLTRTLGRDFKEIRTLLSCLYNLPAAVV